MATLIREHASSRLLRHLAGLNRSRLYADVGEVLAACTAEHDPARPSSPDGEPLRRERGRP